ncbi:MAG: hypothetical protein MUO30_10535, partial [Anaerolineales bacterium]|nr:hypothetical protein [Anaerolineales bacterium]
MEYSFQRIRLEIPDALFSFHTAGEILIIKQGRLNLPHGRKTRQNVDHDTIFIFFKPDYPGHYRFFHIELATRFHIIQKGKDDFFQETSLHPATVVEVANLRGGIGGWEFPPGAAGSQFPEDAV